MTTDSVTSRTFSAEESVEETPMQHHPQRWRLHRGGIVNVWYYYEAEFAFSGGRCIWRGTNGVGKSRAMEMLLPFLLDADRRKMDATGAGKVRLEDLMRAGAEDQANRLGYLWLELTSQDGNGASDYLTIGALVRYSRSSAEAKAWYFTTPLRIGTDLVLVDQQRNPLSREGLAELLGADRLTESPETHRERVRTQVFGLAGEAGRERYQGLLQLLHTLRSPDIGNRIEENRLPGILSEALPPLSDEALTKAGEQLDALSQTRAGQQRLNDAREQVLGFGDVYRRYGAGVVYRAASAARAAAGDDRAASSEAQTWVQEQGRLQEALAARQRERVAGKEAESRWRAEVAGIKESRAYADAQDLYQRGQRVEALGGTADRSLANAHAAREREAEAVAAADTRAAEVEQVAAKAQEVLGVVRGGLDASGVAHSLPAAIGVTVDEQFPSTELVRCERRGDPVSLTRPAPGAVTVFPEDPAQMVQRVELVARAAQTRVGSAVHRLSVAQELAGQLAQVREAERQADEAEARAEEAAASAAASAQHRDAEATAVAAAWQKWVADDATLEWIGEVDWQATAIGALLRDVEALCGPDGDDAELEALDAAGHEAAGPADATIADQLAELRSAQGEADRRREELEDEQAGLSAAQDPVPVAAPWHLRPSEQEVPLWRAVDFVAGLDEQARAGLEGALHAAGLLTATLKEGALTASDGQVLLTPAGEVASSPLSAVLVVEATAGVDVRRVSAVLDRVAFGDRTHPVWVEADGSWGNGPLTGRHHAGVAQHIGAHARAAARERRLADLAALLAALDAEDAQRESDRQALDRRRQGLTAHLRTAPRTTTLARRRAVADDDDARRNFTAARARALRATATEARTAWHGAQSTHASLCTAAGLPSGVEELLRIQRAAEDAARACQDLVERLGELITRLSHHRAALERVEKAADGRRTAESAAHEDWATWQREETELAAIQKTIGSAAAQVREHLRTAEAECQKATTELEQARDAERQADKHVSAAQRDVDHAQERAKAAHAALDTAADELLDICRLPGLLAAATTENTAVAPSLPQVTAEAVETLVHSLTTALDRAGNAVDDTALSRAQQVLERELSGMFDVIVTVHNGVRLIELANSTGQQPLVVAAAALVQRAQESQAALSERERQVFTDFVLGGVTEELRRKLYQAQQIIEAMNTSLATIHTSHGIAVKIRWTLDQDADHSIARIHQLVTLASEVRTTQQDTDLSTLIEDRVNARFATDAAAGYAAHLKAALDYRTWYEMEVIILGPAPGQQRRVSRRSKLSQGEIRFVSYVTLFAAVDAYLSGLPDPAQALRLVMLDDAFAKVDHRTIGELMGLLVRLDIDFAMTGHALWGCFPQVPALDVYEVRRREGGPAITTHVHWDGHTRNFLQAAR
jgi:uncharacterized protein (TIGR02680 family)